MGSVLFFKNVLFDIGVIQKVKSFVPSFNSLSVRCGLSATYEQKLVDKLGWLNIKERKNKQKAFTMFKIFNEMTPVYSKDIFSKNIGTSV